MHIGINIDVGRDRDGDRYNVTVFSVFPSDARVVSSFSGVAIRCLWDSYRWEIRRTPWTTLRQGWGMERSQRGLAEGTRDEPRIRLPLLKGQGPKKLSSSTEEPTGTGMTFVPGLFRLLVLFFVPGIFV